MVELLEKDAATIEGLCFPRPKLSRAFEVRHRFVVPTHPPLRYCGRQHKRRVVRQEAHGGFEFAVRGRGVIRILRATRDRRVSFR